MRTLHDVSTSRKGIVVSDGSLAQLIGPLLEQLADLVAEKVAQRAGNASPKYATAKQNPLGNERSFLDAARRGDFPSFKRSREVAALWSDVEQWIEQRKRPVRQKKRPATAADDNRALLEAAGIRLRPKDNNAGMRKGGTS
jgi:hypothetical protein